MFTDTLYIIGSLVIDHYDANMNLIKSHNLKNLVVTTGKNLIVSRLYSNADAVVSNMGIGTSATVQSLGDTSLLAQAGPRLGLSAITLTGATITYSAVFGPGTGTGSIAEAGLFNAASAGTMLSRTTFAPINKAAEDTLSINWSLTLN